MRDTCDEYVRVINRVRFSPNYSLAGGGSRSRSSIRRSGDESRARNANESRESTRALAKGKRILSN